MTKAKNIYFFDYINKIGGVETFLWELVKKYKSKDILILYNHGDFNQIKRLSQLCRIEKLDINKKYVCERAFFNFDLSPIKQIKAKEKILVVHNNHEFMPNKTFPYHEDIDRVIAVSKDVAKSYINLTGIKCDVSYNPLTIEKIKDKPKVLVSATRLTEEKGLRYMLALNQALERANKPYVWLIFSNNTRKEVISKFIGNVSFMPTTLDIRTYMQIADYVVQLSEPMCEGFNYTVNEALSYGIPCILTNQGVFKELGIYKTPSLFVNDDMSNIDQVAKDIFKPKSKFSYKSPKDSWDKFLVDGKKIRIKPIKTVKVKANENFQKYCVRPTELDHIPVIDEIFEMTRDRINYWTHNPNHNGLCFIDIVKEN